MSIEQPITMGYVFDGVMGYLQGQGHPYATYKPYKTALYRMQRFLGSPMAPYSVQIIEQFMDELSQQLKNGDISKKSWYAARRTVCMANEFFETGSISLGNKTVPYATKFVISDKFARLVDDYGMSLKQKNYRNTTISGNKSDARLFMYYLESKGIEDIKSLDNNTAAGFIPFASNMRKASIGNTLINVRHFLLFLHDQGTISEKVPEALSVHISRPKKIQYGFSNDEVNAMLDAVERSSDMGKRDYAILILAARTGLRSVDIRQLKLTDIKWELGEIRVVQSKTQKPLILPIMEDVGDAISEYILKVRPKLKDKPVFLTIKHPYNGMRYLNDIVEKYARISGVADTTKAPLTIHSFRRGLGVSMLKADVPLSEIIEVLGQTRKNSAKKYLALDVDNLRNCATPMSLFIPEGDAS